MPDKKQTGFSTQVALAFSATSALIYEVVATTVLLFYIPESSYSIAIVLSVFLAGLGIGSLGVFFLQKKIVHPKIVFILLQLAIGVYGVLVFSQIESLATSITGGTLFFSSVLLLLFPTILLGAMFPLASKMLQTSSRDITGLIYAADIIGAVCGALIAGFILIPWYGYSATILIAVVCNAIASGILMFRKSYKTIGLMMILFILVILSPLFIPASEKNTDPWKAQLDAGLDITLPSPYGEVAVKSDILSINNRIQCWYSNTSGVTEITIAQTALEIVEELHPRFLNLGLGCAGTALALASNPDATVDVVEINSVVAHITSHRRVLSNQKNLHLFIRDGFEFMRTSDIRYQNVIIDIESPDVAHSSSLYTVEAFQLASDVLDDHGSLLLWSYEGDAHNRTAFSDVLYATLHQVFPYVYHKETYFIASKNSIDTLEPYTPTATTEINTLDRNTLTPAYREKSE